ncbi:hypothetical protein BD779DRAFT_1489072 [Infundibulicybe gibba]|nr:hypothetical protein BD779DRAFT_1489072 [Infundibulicybe gibba]
MPKVDKKASKVKAPAHKVEKEKKASPAKPVKKSKAISKPKQPEPSSDESSESDSDSDEKPKAAQVKASPAKPAPSSDSSDSDDSDDVIPAPPKVATSKPVNGKATATPKATSKSKSIPKKAPTPSSSSSESDSDDAAELAPSKPLASKSTNGKPTAPKAATSSSDSDSDDVPTPKKATATPGKGKAAKVAPVTQAAPEASLSSDSGSDGSSEDGKAGAKPATVKETDSSEDSSDDESDSDVEMADTLGVNGKRKATDNVPVPLKKLKLDNGETASAGESGSEESKTIFVGRLSWSVDNDRLAQEFASCGEVTGAEVQMDRNTGKSRGFGYVHFATTEAVEAALKMNGVEIDGRPVNIDRSVQRDKTQAREKRAQAFGDEASPPSSTLFVGNLSFSVTEDTVWGFFNEWGVKNVRLPTDRESGRPKGFGYVEFEDIEGAKKAYEAAAGAEIEGRAIRLDYSQPRDASGSGGGRGGGRGFGDRGGGRGGRGGFDRGRGRGGFGDRGGGRGGRGGFGDRGGRGGRGAPRGRGGPRTGGITAFEGRKTTF